MLTGIHPRVAGRAGVSAALVTYAFGILHPKGLSDVGSLSEWMTRVVGSDVWVLVHFMLLVASLLTLVALAGITQVLTEQGGATWARVGMLLGIIATAAAVMTFLIDGAVVKETADRWASDPEVPAFHGAARLATDLGFILVAGLQLTTGATALAFGLAGLSESAHRHLAWLAILTGMVGIVPGSAYYLAGSSTWLVNASYVSSGLFATWLLLMCMRLLRGSETEADGRLRS